MRCCVAPDQMASSTLLSKRILSGPAGQWMGFVCVDAVWPSQQFFYYVGIHSSCEPKCQKLTCLNGLLVLD